MHLVSHSRQTVVFADKHVFVGQGRQGIAVAFASVLHLLLLPGVWAYLHIFFARPVEWEELHARPVSCRLLGASLPTPPVEPPTAIVEKRVLFECDAQGNPLRCHRDQCRGRWKPAR